VRRIEQAGETGQPREFRESGDQVLGVGIVRASSEPGLLPLSRQLQPLPRAGEDRPLDQPVVFEKSDEDGAEDPVYAGLVERSVEKRLKGLSNRQRPCLCRAEGYDYLAAVRFASNASRHSACTASRPALAA
jgi:hypothetical protein